MKYTKQQKKSRFCRRRRQTDDRQNKIFGKKFLEGKIRKNIKNLRLLKKRKKSTRPSGEDPSVIYNSLDRSGIITGGDE